MMNKVKNNSHYDGKIAGLYDLGDTLGRGHFAVVKLAKHVFTGEQVAVKVIDKTKLDEVSRAHLFQEVRCMKLVQHPNVVRLYDVIDTQTKLYLILELGDGGDMYDYIVKHENGVDEETAKKYFRQIVHAISYCHKLHVVHRDLKPENVVFFEKLGMVKLTDFGFSNKFCPGQKLETSCGSLAYSAPEILLGDSYDAPKVDVWSLGVILYMLVCGRAPFQEANDSETLTMIMDCRYTVPQHISPECCKLISDMLIRDPEKRSTLEQIANDPWLNSGDAIQPADYLPLVSREHLSDEDHAHIIQKMVNGNIAAKEEILDALDKNEYNHITATYFLLAERKLRAQRQERAQLINSRVSRADLSPIAVTPSISSAVPSPAQEKPNGAVEGLVSPCLISKPLEVRNFGTHLIPSSPLPLFSRVQETSAMAPSMPLQRKCSIVKEEEDNCSTASAGSSPTKSPSIENTDLQEQLKKLSETQHPNKIQKLEPEVVTVSPSHRPVFSLPVSNNVKTLPPTQNRTSSSITKQYLVGSSYVSQKQKTLLSHGRRLHSVQSSPQLPLNEINEEKDDCTPALHRRGTPKRNVYGAKLHSHGSVMSHVMLKMMEQHKIGKSRTGSCNNLDIKTDCCESSKLEKQQLEGCVGDGSNKCSSGSEETKTHGSEIGANQVINIADNASHASVQSSSSKDYKPEEYKMLKNTPFGHTVFSADSTDSLDFLSDNQPRLVNSMSCGDLSADTGHFALPDKSVVHADSISLTEIPQSVSGDGDISETDRPVSKNCIERISSKYLYPISNSLSLNSGLSSLQRQKKNLKENVHSSQPSSKSSDKNSRLLGLGRLVPASSRSASKQRLDINQNGYKKTESGRRSASATRNNSNTAGQQTVVDMKQASKCCTLC